MAKKILELKRFQSGVVSSASDADIPEESPVFASNVDAISEEGKIKPLKKDLLENDGDYTNAVRVFPFVGGFYGLTSRPFNNGYSWKFYLDDELRYSYNTADNTKGIYDALKTLADTFKLACPNIDNIEVMQDPFVEDTGTLYNLGTLDNAINSTQQEFDATFSTNGLLQLVEPGELILRKVSNQSETETVYVLGYNSETKNMVVQRGENPLAFDADDLISDYINYSHFFIRFKNKGTQSIKVEVFDDSNYSSLAHTFTSQDVESNLSVNPKNAILMSAETNDGADSHTDVVYYDKNDESSEYQIKVIENFYSENESNRSLTTGDWFLGSANKRVSLTNGPKSVYIGMGNKAESISKWFGKIDHKQFNTSYEGYHLEDARLKPTDEDHSVQSMQLLHNPISSSNLSDNKCSRTKDHILSITNHDTKFYYIKKWLGDSESNNVRGTQIASASIGFTPTCIESSLHITKILADPSATYTAWAPSGWEVHNSEPSNLDSSIDGHWQNDTFTGTDQYIQQFYVWTADKTATNSIKLYALRYVDDKAGNRTLKGKELANFRLNHVITVSNAEMNTNLDDGSKIHRDPPAGAVISDIYEKNDYLYIQYYRDSGFDIDEEWLFSVNLSALDSNTSNIQGIEVNAKPITPNFIEVHKHTKDYHNEGYDWWVNKGVFDGDEISKRREIGISGTYTEYGNRFKWRNCDMLGFTNKDDGRHVEKDIIIDGVLHQKTTSHGWQKFMADHENDYDSRIWGYNSSIPSVGYDGGSDAEAGRRVGFLSGGSWMLNSTSLLDMEDMPSDTLYLGRSYGFKENSYRVFPHKKGLFDYRDSEDEIGVACFLTGEQLISKTTAKYEEDKTWKLFGSKKIENVVYNSVNPDFKVWNEWVTLPASRHKYGTLQRTFCNASRIYRSYMSLGSYYPYTHTEYFDSIDPKYFDNYEGSTWADIDSQLTNGVSTDEASHVVSGTSRIRRMRNGFRAGGNINYNEGTTGGKEAVNDYARAGHQVIIPFEIGGTASTQSGNNLSNIMPNHHSGLISLGKNHKYTETRTGNIETNFLKNNDKILLSINSPDTSNSTTVINKYSTESNGNFIDNLSMNSRGSSFVSDNTFGPFLIQNIGKSRILNSKVTATRKDTQLFPTAGRIKSGFVRTDSEVGQTSTGSSDFANNDDDYLFKNAGGELPFEFTVEWQDPVTEYEPDADGNDTAVWKTGRFNDGVTYYWKFSFLYDGFQEGPLTEVAYPMTVNDGGYNYNSARLKLSISNVPKRVSHVVIYRKNAAEQFYRMVTEIGLDDDWSQTPDTENYYRFFQDEGFLGATYEAVTGIPEDLEDTNIHYELSDIGMGHLIVADCWHPEIENAKTWVFKSQPQAYSNFNWSKDYCVLPNKPTAIKWFAGKLYAFDLYNMWRINLETMVIEDTFEGIGCIGPEAILVTDFGMFFADYQGIYYHNGTKAENISRDISQNSAADDWPSDSNDVTTYKDYYWSPWQEIDHQINPHALYSPEDQAVLFCFKNKFTLNDVDHYRYAAWKFSITRKRWDFVELEDFMSVLSGNRNDTYLGGVNKLLKIGANENSLKQVEWISKSFNMGSLSEDKVFISTKLQFNNTVQAKAFYESMKDRFTLYLNNEAVPSANLKIIYKATGSTNMQVTYKLTGISRKFKKMRFTLDKIPYEIDSISIIYRNKNIKA